MDGHTRSFIERGSLACHCVLLEAADHLILLDTGLGLNDVADPKSRLSRLFLAMIRPEFREEMTAARQIERLGFNVSDVRHIILTHLDFDHAGGLDDFPHARVHMLEAERDYALSQKTWLDRQRFRPQQWSSRDRWEVYHASDGEPWHGFDTVRELDGVEPDVVLVPLPGHTHGHLGIAVSTTDGWLLLAGDAYFFHGEMDPRNPRCTPGLRLYQTMMEKDRSARLANQRRLRELQSNQALQITLFCSHDTSEFEKLSGRSARIPVERLT